MVRGAPCGPHRNYRARVAVSSGATPSALGGGPAKINLLVPIDLVIDHFVQL